MDDYLAEATGGAAALLSAMGQDTKAVAVVAATIASYLPFPFVGNLGDMALYALGEQSGTETALSMSLGFIPGGKLAAVFARSKLGTFLGKMGSAAWRTATSLASSAGGFLASKARGLFSRAKNWLRAGCGCFEAGTSVWTDRGLIPIEDVRDGDFVWAQNELTSERELHQVIEIFVRPGAPIVRVLVAFEDGRVHSLRTTEEHPFWIPGRGWVPTQSLRPGATLLAQEDEAVVVGVRFTTQRADVYNFEVEGLHTYLVGPSGVLVHNGARHCFSLIGVTPLPPDKLLRRPKKPGDAPIGIDGKPVEIHHVNQNPEGPFEEALNSEHPRGKVNNPNPGLTNDQRAEFNAARRAYWKRQWELGRFSNLPE